MRLDEIGSREEPPSNWQREKQLSLFLWILFNKISSNICKFKNLIRLRSEYRAAASIFSITLINVHQGLHFISDEIPVDVLIVNLLIWPIVVLVLEQITAVPSENDSIEVDQLDCCGHFLAVYVQMAIFGHWLQEDFLFNHVDGCMTRVDVSTTKNDVIGRRTASFPDMKHV